MPIYFSSAGGERLCRRLVSSEIVLSDLLLCAGPFEKRLGGLGDILGGGDVKTEPLLHLRLHLSADKCDSCLPSLLLYFKIYFVPTDATMFQNIQQFHSGGSNTNSFRLLATLFITKNSIDMRILSTELSQL